MAIDEDTSTARIEHALRQALARQAATRVVDLDLTQLAVDIETALAAPVNPIDPEGDGLTPAEINSANDI